MEKNITYHLVENFRNFFFLSMDMETKTQTNIYFCLWFWIPQNLISYINVYTQSEGVPELCKENT
jgi:hypothetical protein